MQAAVHRQTSQERLNAAINRKLTALGACDCVYAFVPDGNPFKNNSTQTQALVGPLLLFCPSLMLKPIGSEC